MDEFSTDLLKLTPPLGVSATSFLGIPLNEWVYIATIGYVAVQCGCLIYKTYKNYSNKGGN